MAAMISQTPAVLYLSMEGLDVSPGHALLRARGVDVLDIADDPSPRDLERVVALLVGYDRIGPDWLDRLPALRLIATHSAGYDMVDVDAVRERGLWLANLPAAATDEVATHALTMALALVRRLPQYDRDVRQGRWYDESAPLPRMPGELTCGVIGMGRIGQAFAALAGRLFGRVVGYDPVVPDAHWPADVERIAEVDALLGVSDCVSLHLPLSAGTQGLLDARRLALLPPGAVVVNVSRGGLVDEAALLDALRTGRLAGAACDVLVQEPPAADDPMLGAPGILLSPHVAYLSASALRRYAEVPARNVIAFLDHGAPLNPVVSPGEAAASTAP
ncbi:C-terminal binding protein [Planosporangium thailandense]|uniref:C-terminal binding protein n=1 Tax=Planosporangium thailandense TaxID=765197 RepID=A0ABX0Y6N9_9ACTN|nr:C-terminal binding protein [Planosporangium thailandense]NJC74072.1 C-terminal binding protein [Planosporangium thailandense]